MSLIGDNIILILAFCLPPAYLILCIIFFIRNKKKEHCVFAPAAEKHLCAKISNFRIILKKNLILSIIILLCIYIISSDDAMQENQNSIIDNHNHEIIFLFDISSSMLCKDVVPDRITLSKWSAKKIIENLNLQPRTSIVCYAGQAFTLCPMTTDMEAVSGFIDEISPEMTSEQGTDINSGMKAAIKNTSQINNQKNKTDKTIIVFTDGEIHNAADKSTIQGVIETNIKLKVIIIGTNSGGPIMKNDNSYIKDKNGKLVITKADESYFGKIIAETDGKLYRLKDAGGIKDLSKRVSDGITNNNISYTKIPVKKNRLNHKFFLITVAVLIFLLESFIPCGKLIMVIMLLPFLMNFKLSDHGYEMTQTAIKEFNNKNYSQALKYFENAYLLQPDKSDVVLNLGTAYAKNGNYLEAAKYYEQVIFDVSSRNNQKSAAYYNLGVMMFEQYDYDSAYDYFKKAARLDSQSMKIKYNLEVAYSLSASGKGESSKKSRFASQKKDKDAQNLNNAKKENHRKKSDQKDGVNQESNDNEKNISAYSGKKDMNEEKAEQVLKTIKKQNEGMSLKYMGGKTKTVEKKNENDW